MSTQGSAVKAFEDALQLHENEIVIELAPDRVLQFLGVRLVIILAIVAKLTEILVGNLTCHPMSTNVTSVNKGFIAFSQTYCWESPAIGGAFKNSLSKSNPCLTNFQPTNFEQILSEPETLLNLQRWMPFVFLFEAFLYALPSAWWHFRVGGRLMGHLKFMKLLLERIYGKLKTVPVGIANKDCTYDKESCHLDGFCAYDPAQRRLIETMDIVEQIDMEATLKGEKLTQDSIKFRKTSKRSQQTDHQCSSQEGIRPNNTEFTENSDDKASDNEDDAEVQPGKLLDRHLFSILCYENFSSLEQHPYIMSVIQLTFHKEAKDTADLIPMDEAILRQWCHKSNFSGRFLVVRYYIKLVLGIIIDLAMLRVIAFILEILGKEAWHADSYLCDVILYEDVTMICTMHRRTETLALLVLNVIIVLLHLSISVGQMVFISRSYNLAIASFFEYINDVGSLGLRVAMREELRKKKKNKKKKI